MTAHVDVSSPTPLLIRRGDPEAASRAAAALRAGLVVAIPTDTVYGLAAAIDRPDAIGRLYSLKGRPATKAIPVLLDDPMSLERVASGISLTAKALAERFWPGALTLVVPACSDLPAGVTSIADDGTQTVAVRVPDHTLARGIIAAAGGALAVTSANRSGETPALDAPDVIVLGNAAPDVVVDGGRAARAMASTVVVALSTQFRIIREGAIPAAEIFAVVAEIEGRVAVPGRIQRHTV